MPNRESRLVAASGPFVMSKPFDWSVLSAKSNPVSLSDAEAEEKTMMCKRAMPRRVDQVF